MIHLLLEKIENYLTPAPEGRDITAPGLRAAVQSSNVHGFAPAESLALVGGNQIRVMTCGLCNAYRDYVLWGRQLLAITGRYWI